MDIEPEQAVQEEIEAVAKALADASPKEVLRWAFERYGDDVTLACSFGGPSGMMLLDISARLRPNVSVFYLDTDYLFPETYALVEKAKLRYGIDPFAYHARWSVDEQAKELGEALWSSDPDMCCAIRKVEPNGRALEGKSAWIAGLRRDQSQGREETKPVEWDSKFGLVKINPLATWTGEQVWTYIEEHSVPYNELHDRSFPSIGCTHCTRAVLPGEDPRAGRWSGADKVECGLHLPGQPELIGGSGR
jgi:phosphoadenosine phosphosulfate reductase